MIGKFAKCIDLVAAIFLMFLFPAVSIHIKIRDRLFEACVLRVREYGEIMQKQGYLSIDAAEYLFGEGEATNQGEGKRLSEFVEINLWKEVSGAKNPIDLAQAKEKSCDYMGGEVYPLSRGEGLFFQIKMPADGFEKAYYYFCGKVPEREYFCYFHVRDGLLERLGAGGDFPP